MIKLLISTLVLSSLTLANFVETNVKKMKWGDLDVVWVKDDKFPTYDIVVYFEDGALSEKLGNLGETSFMFNELSSGTLRYTQQEILNSLEFYGTKFSANVTHEFSTYSIGGLVKDVDPNLKMICHLFNNATFPKGELNKSKRRAVNGLKNMVTNHKSLANRVFREVSLQGTPYFRPVTGKVKTIQKLNSKKLQERLAYFNGAKKRIYLRGPKSILSIENIIKNDCKWTGKNSKREKPVLKAGKKVSTDKIYLVSVPKANQAQIRLGKVLNKKEATQDQVRLAFSYKYLGGGFTSRLMQELRVKRGLTYSVGAYASGQKNYGRSGISTFTKNVTLKETLKVINETITTNSKVIPKELFMHSMRFIKGNYLLGLESTTGFMNTLLFLDHQGRPYEDIYEFPKKLSKITPSQLAEKVGEIFSFDKQIKLILGDKSLVKDLKKAGYKVKVLDYKKYL